ncbi:imidazolonepropionase [Neptunitalea lumnitzerae]|uniref:Imidazolonepropionase n=1 Tax=Neptunitalea lumnitzerae TaxID=2965509 RepID=A0ABQ5MIG1_9FLAO|nr:imidazolonepropionase [Neptunitalea sp. Y10]GLB49187.1 imidazolonepropionase [Neptunitalea sp. Y10]
MTTLFVNIKELLQIREPDEKWVAGAAMKVLPSIENAYLLVSDGVIVDFGKMEELPLVDFDVTEDCSDRIVLPTWYDSHTHLVYAGNREQEFVDRINGLSYEEIANRGGGILNSAKKLQETPEEELYEQSKHRLVEVMKMGTGGIEIKSGYGLTLEAELKMLRVIKRLGEEFSLPIKATFLGAHAFPAEYKENQEAYIDIIINDMLPKVAAENLAEFIDAFCETGYFSVDQTKRIIEAAQKYGMVPKIHVNQFTVIDGIQMAVECNALSVDHLEVLEDKDIEALKESETMPVALPSCSYFISIPYTPARKLMEAGLPVALASDYNPGTTPSGNMNFVVATACIKMKMTPEEAINAATLNGAYAMNLSKEYGSITKGKKANIMVTKPVPSYYYLPYSFGEQLIDKVMIHGEFI